MEVVDGKKLVAGIPTQRHYPSFSYYMHEDSYTKVYFHPQKGNRRTLRCNTYKCVCVCVHGKVYQISPIRIICLVNHTIVLNHSTV